MNGKPIIFDLKGMLPQSENDTIIWRL